MSVGVENVQEKTNWCQSVTGVVIKDGRVLLARHTYGAGKGKLIVPGGYVEYGESPQQAIVREYKEETGVTVKPCDVIAVRFNTHDWYIAFRAEYICGEASSDNDENSEVCWLELEDALSREDVPSLTKELIKAAAGETQGLKLTDYDGGVKYKPYSLYCI